MTNRYGRVCDSTSALSCSRNFAPAHSKAFHQALLANNVPTQLVIYPDEGHGIRSPRHREDVYRRVLAWFGKYDLHATNP